MFLWNSKGKSLIKGGLKIMEGGNCEQKPWKILWNSATKRSEKMKWCALPGPG